MDELRDIVLSFPDTKMCNECTYTSDKLDNLVKHVALGHSKLDEVSYIFFFEVENIWLFISFLAFVQWWTSFSKKGTSPQQTEKDSYWQELSRVRHEVSQVSKSWSCW